MVVTSTKVVVVKWCQLPKEQREELKAKYDFCWKKDTLVELYTELPPTALESHAVCRDWLWEDHANRNSLPFDNTVLKFEWLNDLGITEDEGLREYLSHLYSENAIIAIFEKFLEFEVTDETTVLLDFSW